MEKTFEIGELAFARCTKAQSIRRVPSGELIFNIFSALAQFERRLVQERAKAGLAVARSRGRSGGRRRIDAEEAKVQAAKKFAADKSLSVTEICETLSISKSTSYRYVAMAGDSGMEPT